MREGAENVAAFVFEPVQGNGGVVPMHPDFFPLARQICDKHGVLMIADEVKLLLLRHKQPATPKTHI